MIFSLKNLEKIMIQINKHVYFINLCSNLRAKNYRILISNEQQTKMIAGKIVTAIYCK